MFFKNCVQFSIPQLKKRYAQTREDPNEGHKDDSVAGQPDSQGKLKELGLFSHEKTHVTSSKFSST